MRPVLLGVALLFPLCAAADVFRCGEPRGVGMWSNEAHKPAPDGFKCVLPIVIVEATEMKVVWGDTKGKGGAGSEKVWNAVIFSRSAEVISAVALDIGPGGAASMLYTIDVKRGYLYMSTHKVNDALGVSTASSFVSKCSR